MYNAVIAQLKASVIGNITRIQEAVYHEEYTRTKQYMESAYFNIYEAMDGYGEDLTGLKMYLAEYEDIYYEQYSLHKDEWSEAYWAVYRDVITELMIIQKKEANQK